MTRFEQKIREALAPEQILGTMEEGAEFFEEWRAFGTDRSKNYAPRPGLILFPRTTSEVSGIVSLAYEYGVPLVPSGGRTGYAGGAVAARAEVVLSLGKMNELLELDPDFAIVRSQAGIITDELNQLLAREGLFFPLQFAATGSTQLGGNLATNAGGVRVVRYGPLRQWVLGLTLVDGTGAVHRLGGPYIKDSSGYDLKSLVVGSEGTLGVITEVTLRLTQPPQDTTVYLLALDSYDQVVRLFRRARSLTSPLAAFEFFSGYCLERVLEFASGLGEPFGERYSHYVLLEVDSLGSARSDGSHSELEELLAEFFAQGVVADGTVAVNSTQARTLWRYREEISEALSLHHIVHKNDISIPMAHLTSFAPKLERALSDNYPEYRVAIFGHLGDGNLHINIVKPDSMPAEAFWEHMVTINDLVYAMVAEYGGSISAEHGLGLVKKKDIYWNHSQAEVAIMRAIKQAFDPKGIMNPGKVLPD